MKSSGTGRSSSMVACAVAVAVITTIFLPSHAAAAEGEPDASAVSRAEEALNTPAEPPPPVATGAKAMSYLQLFLAGGPLMWPILAMSLVAVAFAFERTISLRRSRFVPRSFVERLDGLRKQNPIEIPQLRRLCDESPSVAGRIVRVIVDKLGRPLAEVERAVSEAKDREATSLYANIRPISLAASITPLIGLLGTVQGMILSFHTTANMAAGADRASALAGGIYIALLTTFAGLCVAIPAAVLAHWLEGRILRGFRDVDAVTARLWRLVEKCETSTRIPTASVAGTASRVGQAAVP